MKLPVTCMQEPIAWGDSEALKRGVVQSYVVLYLYPLVSSNHRHPMGLPKDLSLNLSKTLEQNECGRHPPKKSNAAKSLQPQQSGGSVPEITAKFCLIPLDDTQRVCEGFKGFPDA